MTDGKKYQVALSFAGEQRGYVEEVYKQLHAWEIKVFYDDSEKLTLWGKSGFQEFQKIYGEESEYVVLFVSRDYAKNMWSRAEFQTALHTKMKDRKDSILPVRFDDTELPGLPKDIIYVSAHNKTPAEIASMIATKLGILPLSKKASEVPPPQSVSLTGEVGFDWNSYNGRYIIGSEELKFEIQWDGCGKTSARILNWPDSIEGVAVAKGATSISQVQNAESLDYTSRHRKFSLGQVMVLRNTKDFYAAIQLLSIKDMDRGDEKSEFRFRYAIQSDGSGDFSEFQDWEAAAAE